jgi:hypothetical protein
MIAALTLFAAAAADPIAGTWEGTSLCQVKPSPCHDEHVIYRVRSIAPRRYQFDAYKLVGGKESFMGTINLTFLPAQHQLHGTISGQRGTADVRFSLNGRHLSGSMTLDGQLYRLIEVDKL